MAGKNLFQFLSQEEKFDVLFISARESGCQPFVFEKDIWVVQDS